MVSNIGGPHHIEIGGNGKSILTTNGMDRTFSSCIQTDIRNKYLAPRRIERLVFSFE